VTKWLVRSRDTVFLSYPARAESQNGTFSVNIVYRVYDSFCLFAYAGSVKRAARGPLVACQFIVYSPVTDLIPIMQYGPDQC